MTKTEIVKEILDRACKLKTRISIDGNNSIFLCSGDDSSGQRQSYLEHWGYGKPDPTSFLYKIKRKLSFCNKGDEGKEDAVMFIINIKDLSDIKFTIGEDYLKLGELTIHFYEGSIWQK